MLELIISFGEFPGLQNMFLTFFTSIGESGVVIAQAGLDGFMTRILNVFRLVSILFSVMGLMYAAYQLNSGDIRSALLGICAAGLMGASYIIVISLFGESTDGLDIDQFLGV